MSWAFARLPLQRVQAQPTLLPWEVLG